MQSIHITYLLPYLLTYFLVYLLTYVITYLVLTYFLPYLLMYLLTYIHTYLLTYLFTYLLTYLLTPCSRVLLERLTGSQLVKKFPTIMQPEGSLPHSQQPATCPYPEPARSSPCPHIHFLKICLNIIFPSRPGFSKWCLSLRFPH